MSRTFDVIVLGLGGMGSAAAYHLAVRGRRVLGLDQFTPPHDQGSSHGQSRVIRQAYYEDPAYVPLLLRAYELWRKLERDSGKNLLTVTGGLMMGTRDSGVVAGSLRSARKHGLPHELFDAYEIRKRFPQFTPEADTVALHEKNAGFVRPEEAVRAHLNLAAKRGAQLHFEEKVLSWDSPGSAGILPAGFGESEKTRRQDAGAPRNGSVRVTTARGTYEAGQLVICAGPWLGKVAADLALPLQVERQVQFWFEPVGGIGPFLPDKFPVWIWETQDGTHPYGLPALDGASGGVKFSMHHGGKNPACTPDTIERTVTEAEIAAMRSCIASRIPALAGRCLRSATCMYTNTPDGHFIIDRHPAHPQVLIVSPCSGHGFKFCSVIGEIVADLVTANKTAHPTGLFGLARLSRSGNGATPGVKPNE